MDILYVTRSKTRIIGWNDGKVVFEREFQFVDTARIFKSYLRAYIRIFGSIPADKIDQVCYAKFNKTEG